MSLWGPCHSGQQVSGGHVHYGGYVKVGRRSVVAMSLWGPCHSSQRVSGGHVTVGPCHIGQQVSSGHVTVGAMSQWAAGQW